MASGYLTKSDFKVACDCRTRLYYRKQGYPTALDDNDYMRLLADGGFMIETIAKAKYPDGIDLVDERSPEKSFELTRDLLAKGDVTIFEAAATVGKLHARIDILQRKGDVLRLIEVKSSSIDGDNDVISPFLTRKGTVSSDWRDYIWDVAFQVYALRLAFPEYNVVPYLCVVDKSQPVREAETLGRFALAKDKGNPKARPIVTYLGKLSDLASSALVCERNVENEVKTVMGEVVGRTHALAELISEKEVTRVQEDILGLYAECKGCLYRVAPGLKSGFDECWGKLAHANPHILELHRVTQIGSTKVTDPVPGLLKRGSATYLDLEEGDLGSEGSRQQRRLLQWKAMKEGGKEVIPGSLKAALAGHHASPGWPLHFVDFEACDIALPHHAGLRPYERVAFQWSCHTVAKDGTLSHAEWLNTKMELPNFAFAASLRTRIGDSGTIYVWSHYEQTTLRKILGQIVEWLHRDANAAVAASGLPDKAALDDLAAWIDSVLGPEDEKGKRHPSRIKDLHDLALQGYFHPMMGGRTSIKVVLPSVWTASEKVRTHPWFKQYLAVDKYGVPMDPYATLPALPFGDEDAEDDVVREGTGAIRVYQDMLFASSTSAAETEARSRLLRQYCALDTAAMVMIWMHWTT
jgi:hypothetical protein